MPSTDREGTKMMGELGITTLHESKSDAAFSAAEHLVQPISIPPLTPKPLVSVIVANYNYGRFLPDAAQSILDQTYSNWELIICDDGSTDASRKTLLKLEQQDPRIKSLFKENGGQASAWNHAFEQCSGDVICLLDADDWFREDKLELIVGAFADHSGAGFAYHRSQPTDASGVPRSRPHPDSVIDGWLYHAAIERGGYIVRSKTSDICLRREIANRVFPIPTELGPYGDAFVGKVVPFITEIVALPDALSYYRIHGSNHSASAFVDQLNASSLEKWVQAHLISDRLLRRFLEQEVDESIACRISLENLRAFWDCLARLYILHGKPTKGVMGFPVDTITDRVRLSRKWLFWRLCFALPHPVSLWLLRLQVRSFETIRSRRWRVRNVFVHDRRDSGASADYGARQFSKYIIALQSRCEKRDGL